MPVTLGAAYGLYASFILRNNGASGGRQFWYGLICAVVLAVLCFALGRIQHTMIPLMRAVAYGALTSAAFGLLVGLTDSSVLRSSALGLSIGLGMFITTFYIFYTHEKISSAPT
jgi:Na+(H+)/acetate symporter ActP